jgi:HK97 family phage prohead protease
MNRTRLLQSPARFGAKAYDGDLLIKASHEIIDCKADDSEPGRISGYGSVFGKVDSYNESVQPGAFAKSLKAWQKSKRPIPMLWNHKSDEPVGVWDQFEEDAKGLKMSGTLLVQQSVPQADMVYSLAKAKAIGGLSIGYYEMKADPYNYESEDPRRLFELDLREVSPVTFPALKEAQLDVVKARLARGERLTLREFETVLREKFRFSRSEAEEIATLGYSAWLQRDVGPGALNDWAGELEQFRSMPRLVLPSLS